ncbi:acyltransferase family protein [Citrobacter freundii]|uniref:acyltransferase family protein n=1 Tax=Citrobacter freundii TaxID=546 RepID=UPI001BCC0814|nr:acyltransferase [Citrobacter freundii]
MSTNNFDLCRLLLAGGILLVHAAGITDTQELKFIFDYLNGDELVKCFFVISGYLVTKSYYRESGANFYIKRGLRIFPAYLFIVLATVFIGAVLTSYSIGDFFESKYTWRYIALNIIPLNFLAGSLPGVFDSNPLNAINGSLWTVKSEIILYLSMPFYSFFYKRVGVATFVVIFLISFSWIYYFLYIRDMPSRTLAMQFVGLALYYYGGALFASLKNEKKAICFILLYSFGLYWLCPSPWEKVFFEPGLVVSGVLFVCVILPQLVSLKKNWGPVLWNISL